MSWTASTDNIAVAGYELDRSTDMLNWTPVTTSTITDTFYEDDTVDFSTTYYYRLRAFDATNNYSSYASTNITSSGFQVNLDPSRASTITSDDKLVSIQIPAGSLTQPTFCIISTSQAISPLPATKSKVLAGPYQLVCRDADGNVLSNFTKPLTLSLQLNKIDTSGVASVSYYSYENNQWQLIQPQGKTGQSGVVQFDVSNSSAFAVVGKPKSTPLWVKLVITLLVLIGLVIVAWQVMHLLLRRKYQQQYDDYVNKMHGGL